MRVEDRPRSRDPAVVVPDVDRERAPPAAGWIRASDRRPPGGAVAGPPAVARLPGAARPARDAILRRRHPVARGRRGTGRRKPALDPVADSPHPASRSCPPRAAASVSSPRCGWTCATRIGAARRLLDPERDRGSTWTSRPRCRWAATSSPTGTTTGRSSSANGSARIRLHALERRCDLLTAQGRVAEAIEAGLAVVARRAAPRERPPGAHPRAPRRGQPGRGAPAVRALPSTDARRPRPRARRPRSRRWSSRSALVTLA